MPPRGRYSPTTVIRRDVFDDVGMLDETLVPCGEDWDLWLRIAAHYEVGVVRLPLARYRVRRGSMSSVLNYQVGFQRFLTVIERAATRDPERLGALRNQALTNVYIGTGMTLAGSGNHVEARRMFAQAIRLRPSSLQAYVYWMACLSGRPILNAAIRLRHWVRRKRTLGWRA